MPEDEPVPISEPIEEALLRVMRPDLLQGYLDENERHRQELRAIEIARQRARSFLWRCFRGPLLEQKRAELEREHTERVQGETDRHAAWVAELKETVLDHVDPHRHDEPAA